MELPKLSIIVPVYNVEKYLKKCIDRILASTYKYFELIIINDGTKDNSEQIIKEYLDKEEYKDKIIYIAKENSGLSDTRNLGMSKARGEYIAFVDSDDYIETDMYELLMNKALENNFDMVVSDLKLVYENNDKEKVLSSGYEKDLFNKEEIKRTMAIYYPVVWNRVCKKDVLEGIKFSKGVWYEDMEFNLELYPKLNSIGVVKKPLYNYLQRAGSITYTYNDKLFDIINNMDNVIKYYKENKLYDEYKEELEYLYARYAFATFPKRLAKCKDKKKYKEGIDFAIKKVNEHFPEYKNNPYFKKMGLKGKYIKNFNKFISRINYIISK